jgi:hypothetical protein
LESKAAEAFDYFSRAGALRPTEGRHRNEISIQLKKPALPAWLTD